MRSKQKAAKKGATEKAVKLAAKRGAEPASKKTAKAAAPKPERGQAREGSKKQIILGLLNRKDGAALTFSTPTFSVSRRCRLVYVETGGNLEAIPWEVLADAVRRSIWPNLVLERIREWQWDQEVRMGVGSSAEVGFAMSAAA